MSERRHTNRLLVVIAGLLAMQTYLMIERAVQAETLRLDFCITDRMGETPEQYLHVVTHNPDKWTPDQDNR